MAISSFLTEGAAIPQGSAVTDMTKQTILPDFYTNYAQEILSEQKALANRPYATSPVPRVAGFTPAQLEAFQKTGVAADAYKPGLAAATTAAQGAAASPGALTTAQPYLTAAGGTSVANIDQYMNPYMDAVINRIGELGTRNLTDVIMPQLEGRYIQAGQLGYGGRGGASTSSGMMTDTARAVRDTSADILGAQSTALQGGYNAATGLASVDLARNADLATTAGGLASKEKADALAAANTLSGLAGAEQSLGLTGAGALGAVGAQQQQQGQKSLDVAQEDWLRQQGYPQEQIDKMMAAFKGVAAGVPTATQEQGISPSGVQQQYPASTAAQVGSVLTGLGGLLDKGGVLDKLIKP